MTPFSTVRKPTSFRVPPFPLPRPSPTPPGPPGAGEGGPFVQLHDPAEPGLVGVGGIVNVVAVERVARLEPQGVARAQPDGRPTPLPHRSEEHTSELQS